MQSLKHYRVLWMSGAVALLAAACCAQPEQTPLEQWAASVVSQITNSEGARELKGKTVAVAEFLDPGRTGVGTASTRMFQTKLIDAFVKAKHFRVVERDQLDKAMRELKFDASGLVDPSSQKQLGSFLSADYIVLGEVSSEAGGSSLDARLVAVETGEIAATASVTLKRGGGVDKNLYELQSYNLNEVIVRSLEKNRNAATGGSVQWLVGEQILSKDVAATWQPELDKNVFSQPERYVKSLDPREDAYYVRIDLTQLFRDMVAIFFGEITPRIAVSTTEIVVERQVPDPAVQTSIMAALVKYGFQVVDSEQAQSALEREQFLQVDSGDAAAFKVVATELKADIIVKGESFAEEHADGGRFDARVEYAVVEGTTGRVLAAIPATQTNIRGGSALVAAKIALQKAADKSTLRMMGAILNSYGKPISQLRVWKITDFKDQSKIKEGLQKALPGVVVSNVSSDLRSSKCAVFSVSLKRSASDIAEALESISGLRLKVSAVECRSIVCEMQ